MKRLLLFVILVLALASICFGGKETVTPNALQLNSDKVELMEAKFVWGSIPAENSCVIMYKIWSNDRTKLLREETFTLSGSEFTTLVNSYGGTMEARLLTSIWQDIQAKWGIVP